MTVTKKHEMTVAVLRCKVTVTATGTTDFAPIVIVTLLVTVVVTVIVTVKS